MTLTKEDMARLPRLLLEAGKELGLFSEDTLLVEVEEALQLMFEKRLKEVLGNEMRDDGNGESREDTKPSIFSRLHKILSVLAW